jgi:hypothetical protein
LLPPWRLRKRTGAIVADAKFHRFEPTVLNVGVAFLEGSAVVSRINAIVIVARKYGAKPFDSGL